MAEGLDTPADVHARLRTARRSAVVGAVYGPPPRQPPARRMRLPRRASAGPADRKRKRRGRRHDRHRRARVARVPTGVLIPDRRIALRRAPACPARRGECDRQQTITARRDRLMRTRAWTTHASGERTWSNQRVLLQFKTVPPPSEGRGALENS